MEKKKKEASCHKIQSQLRNSLPHEVPKGSDFKRHKKITINTIKNCSNAETWAAWLHWSRCLAYSNHKTGAIPSFTSYEHGVFTLLQATAFLSQLDADSTNWNNNGIANWFLKIKNQKETNYTMQFICNNRNKIPPQGKNYLKSLESIAGFFLRTSARVPALYGRAISFLHANGRF